MNSYRYGAHGIDLDWEYPCSPKRNNPVKISCSKFQSVDDTGGSCPADTDNLLALMQDLRTGLGDTAILSIASQAGAKNADNMNLGENILECVTLDSRVCVSL